VTKFRVFHSASGWCVETPLGNRHWQPTWNDAIARLHLLLASYKIALR
jgi:hypothetical protein